jgi:hypothetical protein
MKTLKLLAVVAALAVVGLCVWGFIFGGLGSLVYRGTNYMADQHGFLLMVIVLISVICAVVMAVCRNQK